MRNISELDNPTNVNLALCANQDPHEKRIENERKQIEEVIKKLKEEEAAYLLKKRDEEAA